MAAVAAQNPAAPWQHEASYQHHRHSSSSSSTSTAHQQQSSSSSSARKSSRSSGHQVDSYDRFYGHRDLAELCERVILALFACPLDSTSSSVGAAPSSPSSSTKAAPRLSEFIAYALHRTRLPLAVTHQALFLLKRLKSRFPAARGSSGHRLFISALMLASKATCDDTYSNKSWTIVGQGLFSLREVNQMERELFGYLGFRVNVEPEELDDFVIGLEHGRIHAATEPVSPAMGASSHFHSTSEAEGGAMSPCSGPAAAQPMSASPARVHIPSPSAASEPSFEPSTSSSQLRAPRTREASSASAGPHPTSRSSRHLQHPHTSAAAFNRASIAGYPSMMTAQQRSMSLSVPGAASSSDSSLDRVAQRYDGRNVSGVPIYVNDTSSSSYSSSSDVSMRAGYPAPSAAPSVPMQGYYSSPSAASLASSSRGSMSSTYGCSDAYEPSPYARHSSSNHTTPETPSSDFDSPDDSGDDEDDDLVGSSDASNGVDFAYEEQPAGTFDREHQIYSKDHIHSGGRSSAAPPIFSPHYSMALSEQQKMAAIRYQQQQQQQQQRQQHLAVRQHSTNPSQWS